MSIVHSYGTFEAPRELQSLEEGSPSPKPLSAPLSNDIRKMLSWKTWPGCAKALIYRGVRAGFKYGINTVKTLSAVSRGVLLSKLLDTSTQTTLYAQGAINGVCFGEPIHSNSPEIALNTPAFPVSVVLDGIFPMSLDKMAWVTYGVYASLLLAQPKWSNISQKKRVTWSGKSVSS